MIGDELDLETMRGRVSAAVARAEAEALRAHEAGECHLSEWSCSHCESAAELTEFLLARIAEDEAAR